MPLSVPIPPPAGTSPIGNLSLLAMTPTAVSAGYSWGYVQESKTLPTYSSTSLNTPFVGGLLDLLSAARLTDLNATRAAYENLRQFTEALAKQHNQLCRDLIAAGIIST